MRVRAAVGLVGGGKGAEGHSQTKCGDDVTSRRLPAGGRPSSRVPCACTRHSQPPRGPYTLTATKDNTNRHLDAESLPMLPCPHAQGPAVGTRGHAYTRTHGGVRGAPMNATVRAIDLRTRTLTFASTQQHGGEACVAPLRAPRPPLARAHTATPVCPCPLPPPSQVAVRWPGIPSSPPPPAWAPWTTSSSSGTWWRLSLRRANTWAWRGAWAAGGPVGAVATVVIRPLSVALRSPGLRSGVRLRWR